MSRKRTAVLVVHGIGSQRAQTTVRGVVNAVWFDDSNPPDGSGARKVWTHPERSGTDLDLLVTTTSKIPGSVDSRSADFLELYWAHLMSETKAVAVLLWLYELGRKGPHFFKRQMNVLWWGAAVFLCLLHLSVAVLAFRGMTGFVSLWDHLHMLIIAPYAMVFAAACLAACVIVYYKLFTRRPLQTIFYFLVVCFGPALLFVIVVILSTALSATSCRPDGWLLLGWVANTFLPLVVAGLMTYVLMGKWGWQAFKWLLYASYFVLVGYLIFWGFGRFSSCWFEFHLPWSITSQTSNIAALVIVGIYLAIHAAFLQPYLGDAARYFRNSPANVAVRREIRKLAVDTLDRLHTCGDYDRIVVVAHSQGAVIAYDMLRAYYSHINHDFPPHSVLGPQFTALDNGTLARAEARISGRAVIHAMAQEIVQARQHVADGSPRTGEDKLKAWLVTDFVTLGSPLTHAQYLMCHGGNYDELRKDFDQRTRERELPTCPPRKLDLDRLLTYSPSGDDQRRFHHGGLFALTRWTNLYFPMEKLFWGDAIGGPVATIFGDPGTENESDRPAMMQNNIVDVPVYSSSAGGIDFFSHNNYWVIDTAERYSARHIVALKNAIDLEDVGTANAVAGELG